MSFALLVVVGFVAFCGGLIAWGFARAKRQREQRAAALRQAIEPVDATVVIDESSGSATTTAHGLLARFHFATRGSGSSSESWTEVDVDVDLGPLVLHVRPHRSRDHILLEQGLGVDLELGNEAFDAAFFVEAAPAEVVRVLFTSALQERLLALAPDELESKPAGLCLAKRGWNEDPASIAEFIDLAATLAAGIEPAIRAVVEAAAPPPITAYRGDSTSAEGRERRESARKDTLSRLSAEAAQVEQVRAQRSAATTRLVVIVVAVSVIGFSLLMWQLTR